MMFNILILGYLMGVRSERQLIIDTQVNSVKQKGACCRLREVSEYSGSESKQS
ncbi:hypothetical protein [Endozoicomonas sp. OPT23]|uniref:hypothetical protein n=1 Tax=Endozoicomonas sp. OPT23 TaxID=2072845 RepID=UPI00129B0731